jgi:Acetyltransferase (GNAT) domain
MNKAEYAGQMSELGWKVAYNGGTWWFGVKPFYFMPLHIIEQLDKEAGPPIGKSFLGYQYVVKDERDANCRLSFMTMKKGAYDINRLSSSTRNHIRKGLKTLEIKPIEDIREMLEKGLEINHSALTRQKRLSDHSRLTEEKSWTRDITVTFGKKGWTDLGAYKDGRLIAYLRGLQVEDVLYISQRCGHEDFLRFCPNDALYHCFLESANADGNVTKIVAGYESSKETLNEFKRKFGFETARMPAYRWITPLIRPVLRFTRYRYYLDKWK